MFLSSLGEAFSGMLDDLFEIGLTSRMGEHVVSGGSSGFESQYKEPHYEDNSYDRHEF